MSCHLHVNKLQLFATSSLTDPLTFDFDSKQFKKKKKNYSPPSFSLKFQFWGPFVHSELPSISNGHVNLHTIAVTFFFPTIASSSSTSVPRQYKCHICAQLMPRHVSLITLLNNCGYHNSSFLLFLLCTIVTMPRQFARLCSTTVATTLAFLFFLSLSCAQTLLPQVNLLGFARQLVIFISMHKFKIHTIIIFSFL